ncbi:MAG: carboxypeptidase-like regulatory domain-containing protein, partial [Thermoanaerobaculia bacterium]
MIRFISIRQWLVLVVTMLLSLPLAAQTVTGTLEGTVSDLSGSALPGVTVTIRDKDTGLERVTVTNSDGRFSAP